MMLQLPDVLARSMPGRFTAHRLAMAAVYTTRPKYLVFEHDPARPVCVVDIGEVHDTLRRHGALQRLHALIPGMTAEPLACILCGDQRAMHVESGLAGIPWFALGRVFQTRSEWQSVVQRAAGSLRAFQGAVAHIPEWTAMVAPGFELRRQLGIALTRGMPLPDESCALVESRARALDLRGERRFPWQHGDFSLNNLLIDRESVGIIDFEELGMTSVPLHDEIGLAISVGLTYPKAPILPAECLDACLSSAVAEQALSREEVEGLVLHHLLWRINACAASSRRGALAVVLTKLFDAFTDDPRAFMSSSAAWSAWLEYKPGS